MKNGFLATVSADGWTVTVTFSDGSKEIWDSDTGEDARALERMLNRCRSIQELRATLAAYCSLRQVMPQPKPPIKWSPIKINKKGRCQCGTPLDGGRCPNCGRYNNAFKSFIDKDGDED